MKKSFHECDSNCNYLCIDFLFVWLSAHFGVSFNFDTQTKTSKYPNTNGIFSYSYSLCAHQLPVEKCWKFKSCRCKHARFIACICVASHQFAGTRTCDRFSHSVLRLILPQIRIYANRLSHDEHIQNEQCTFVWKT